MGDLQTVCYLMDKPIEKEPDRMREQTQKREKEIKIQFERKIAQDKMENAIEKSLKM